MNSNIESEKCLVDHCEFNVNQECRIIILNKIIHTEFECPLNQNLEKEDE